MEKRKVFKLINSLQPKEKRKLDQWLGIELSEKQSAVHLLYKLLIKNTQLAVVWKTLFPSRKMPKQALQDQQLRRLENHLTERISTFLAIEQFRKDEAMRDVYLIKALNERPQTGVFMTEYKKVKRRLEAKPVRNSDYYQVLYLLEKEFQYFRVKHLPKNYTISEEYDQLLDTWWLHEKMRLANVYLPAQNPQKKLEAGSSLAHAMEITERDERYFEMPMLQIYLQQYKLHTQGLENHQIPEWLWTYGSWLKPKERRDMFINLTNYYINKKNITGDPYYHEQLYLLVRWGTDEGLNLLDGYLPWQSYHLLCTLIFQFESLNTGLELVESYKELVPKNEREQVFSFHLGNYYFRKKEYRSAIRALNQKFSLVSLERAARILLLMTRYETGDRTELENEVRALGIWLNRQNVFSKTIKEGTLMFLKILGIMTDYQAAKHQKHIESLFETEKVVNKAWLQKKLAENTQTMPQK